MPVNIALGLLRARDLVELYYGGRMVATDSYSKYAITPGTTTEVITGNPRRIGYEIVVTIITATDTALVYLGPRSQIEAGNVAPIYLWATENIQVSRSFREELDLVAKGLSIKNDSTSTNNVEVFVREVWLTALPVDELP